MKIGSHRIAAILALAAASASPAFGQTAYFSTQGSFTTAATNQLLFFDLARAVTSAETLRFESFSGRGTTLNAAGETSPVSPTGFDSVLDLFSPGGVQIASNDDGAAGLNIDSLLSWPGLADSGGNLGAGPLTAGVDYRIRVREFDDETGPWGVDLVGPADAIVFRDFSPDQGAASPSNVRSIRFGTNGIAAVGSAEAHAIFRPTPVPTADYKLTGDLVVANTGNASFIMDSTDGDRFTVAGATSVKVGGDVTLSGNATLNLNAFVGIDGGRVSLSGTSRLNINAPFANVDSGGRIDVNAGATFAAPNTFLGIGAASSAAEAQLVVTNGTVTTRNASIGANAGTVGRAVVTGASGRWTLTERLFVGNAGTGALDVTAGGQVTSLDGAVGFNIGGVGTATVSGAGSVWTSTRDLSLGDSSASGVGTLTIGSGARLNVGDAAAALPADDYSYVDDTSANTSDGGLISVYNGSTLTNNNTGLVLGEVAGHSGRVLVSGAGSTLNTGQFAFVGNRSSGVLDVRAGGSFVVSINLGLGHNFAGRGVATVDGTSSRLIARGDVSVGSVNGNATPSSLTMANGGQLFVGDLAGDNLPNGIDISDADPIATNGGGLLAIRAGGTVTAPGSVLLGRENGASGRLLVTGNGSTLSGGIVFVGNRGRGDARLQAGGDLIAGQLVIGAEDTSDGTMTVTGGGSTATAQVLDVGTGKTGLLTIAAGGGVNVANDATLGGFTTGVGTITLTDAGSTLDVNGDLRLGIAGRSVVNLSAGAGIAVGDTAAVGPISRLVVSDANLSGTAGGNVVLNNASTWVMNDIVNLGDDANRYGRLAVNGTASAFSTNSLMLVGTAGTGVLDVTAGGRVTLTGAGNGTGLVIGAVSGGRGTATVDGAGSLLDVNNSVSVGNTGVNTGVNAVGTLIVRNGGLLAVGDLPTSTGLINVSVDVADATLDGSAGGTIDVRPGSLLDAGGNVVIAGVANSFGQINVGGASARLKSGSTIAVGVRGNGRLDVTDGGIVEATAALGVAVLNGSSGLVNVTGTGSRLTAAGDLVVGSNTNASPGRVNINSGGLVRGGTLAISAASKIDIGNGGTLEVASPGSSLAAIRNFVSTGYVGGAWTGNGITSTAAQTDPRLGVGYRDSAGFITVRLTLKGDADLSLAVGFDDLLALAQNYGGGSGKHWQQGDFNYDGTVGFDDLLALAQNYNQPLSTSEASAVGAGLAVDWALAQSMVPEPAALIGLAMASVVGRRRRR